MPPDPLGDLLDQQLETLRSNRRLAIVFCVSVLAVGVLATLILAWLKLASDIPELKIGPTLVGAGLAPLQYKTIAYNREREATLRTLRAELKAAEQLPPDSRQRLVDMAWKAIQETTGRA